MDNKKCVYKMIDEDEDEDEDDDDDNDDDDNDDDDRPIICNITYLCICMHIYIYTYGGFHKWWHPQNIHLGFSMIFQPSSYWVSSFMEITTLRVGNKSRPPTSQNASNTDPQSKRTPPAPLPSWPQCYIHLYNYIYIITII